MKREDDTPVMLVSCLTVPTLSDACVFCSVLISMLFQMSNEPESHA